MNSKHYANVALILKRRKYIAYRVCIDLPMSGNVRLHIESDNIYSHIHIDSLFIDLRSFSCYC